MPDPEASSSPPTFNEALRFWLKLGFISFGGPTGQIAIMHEELVERRKWISEPQFLHALNFCMLLPGPEAQQLAIYIGWILHRTWGGIVAGVLFVLPAAIILWVLSWLYVSYGELESVAAIFHGLKAAVLAVVVSAAIRIGSRVLKNPLHWGIAATAFGAIFFLKAPFPVILLGAGIVGLLAGTWRPDLMATAKGHRAMPAGQGNRRVATVAPSWRRAMIVISVCLCLWWLPVWGLGAWLGSGHTVVREGIFFSKAAMVTFGGAYAVLPYVGQQAVEGFGWLSASQMMDGLGLAETTPGPLVMVLQFVGFVGAYQNPGDLPPLLAATLGAAITTWVTFVPCFLWIFLGAPHIEQLRNNLKLTAALSAVTAAVVGVILNLAAWFGEHALWVDSRIDWFVLLTALVASAGMWRWKWKLIVVIIACGVAGLLLELLR